VLRGSDIDFSLIEEVSIFAVGEDGTPATSAVAAAQFCISIEEPSLTLQSVVDGMIASEDCQTVPAVRHRYAEKVFAVLRLVAKGLRHLHALNLVHFSVDAMNCGKYGSRWKLRNAIGIKERGESVDFDRCQYAPELVGLNGSALSDIQPPADVWAFGKLSFEILVGEPLFGVGDRNLRQLLAEWDSLKVSVHARLVQSCVTTAGSDLIISCLHPNPSARPTISDVLRDAFWQGLKRQSESREGESLRP
jgi:hypothetical protein